MKRQHMTRQQIEVIVSMYKDGASYAEIGEVLGKPDHVVHYWIRHNRGEYGLDRRRALVEKANTPLSLAAQDDSKWNIRRGLEYITRRWA